MENNKRQINDLYLNLCIEKTTEEIIFNKLMELGFTYGSTLLNDYNLIIEDYIQTCLDTNQEKNERLLKEYHVIFERINKVIDYFTKSKYMTYATHQKYINE